MLGSVSLQLSAILQVTSNWQMLIEVELTETQKPGRVFLHLSSVAPFAFRCTLVCPECKI
jgi:hypothetical protein